MNIILAILIGFFFDFKSDKHPRFKVELDKTVFHDSLLTVQFSPQLTGNCENKYLYLTICLPNNDTIRLCNVPCEYINKSDLIYIEIGDKKSCEARMAVNEGYSVIPLRMMTYELYKRAKNDIYFILP